MECQYLFKYIHVIQFGFVLVPISNHTLQRRTHTTIHQYRESERDHVSSYRMLNNDDSCEIKHLFKIRIKFGVEQKKNTEEFNLRNI